MAERFVDIDSLGKSFGDFAALSDCSLAVERGEVLGLLGPNGAGKSTLLRLLLGFLKPTSGGASIDGLDCYRQRTEVHSRLSYLPGDARLLQLMRGRSVLKFFCSLRRDADFPAAERLAERLDLDLSRWVGLMSTGMRQKLALAVTMSVDAPLLILDEPTANLDPTVRGEVLSLVLEAKAEGKTVIFSSHVLSEIDEVCDRVCILRAGELVHSQSMERSEKTHLIEARLVGNRPALPALLEDRAVLSVSGSGSRLSLETRGELSPVLAWLAEIEVTDVYIQQTGLRVVYERFHPPTGRSPGDA